MRHSRFGLPAEVAELVDLPALDDPAPGEVVIAGVLAPVHPADLLSMEGRYGLRRAELPVFCGSDGIGRIAAVGGQVEHLRVGDRVPLLLAGVPTWREGMRAKAADLIALPDGDPQQLSLLGVNPITAWALLRDVVPLGPGDWVVQNAAGSSVGRAVFTLARRLGLRSVSVVRRADAVDELVADGADVVLVDGDDLPRRIAEATGGQAPRLGIDAVGGAATGRLGSSLARRGTLVAYGLLSGDPCTIDPADIIFRDVSCKGFWLALWIRRKSREELEAAYRSLADLIADGTLHSPIAAVYPLSRIGPALAHAASGPSGKVLLELAEAGG
ncbi:zinc-dependent alcohol dehydrogenase family protein [Xanthobacter autotrophicus]|uniref:zinc-dependent alcohol dehydrogenase family protein n=1 Tax=Xanthobacter autotrophicus TaxID=280 RepID=UPI003729ADA0